MAGRREHILHIAYFPLTPLGDAVVEMGALHELHKWYAPCKITVFAIEGIVELYKNYRYCDEARCLRETPGGGVVFRQIPQEHYDVIFNHGYCDAWTQLLAQMKYTHAYGMEEASRPPETCARLFAKWVSSQYWNEVTLRKYHHVSGQMAELIRLVNPRCKTIRPRLSGTNYRIRRPIDFPAGKYALLLPGASNVVKQWPIQKFLQLAQLLGQVGVRPVFVLGPREQGLKSSIAGQGYPCLYSLSMAELAYCIVHAEVIVGNDTGPMHFAACFKNTRTVHLFSFSGAETWFQYSARTHKLIMPDCKHRQGRHCRGCHCSCIGKISLTKVWEAVQALVGLSSAKISHVGYFAPELVGDALVGINALEELSRLYAPCEITVFCTGANAILFERYAFCNQVVSYVPGQWKEQELPREHFEVVFNARYDLDSVKLIQRLRHSHAYGYENIEIPEEVCRQVYDGYLPLSLWDDQAFRYNTSITEQHSALVRLVSPDYHLWHIHLAENTFVHNYEMPVQLKPNTVIFVRGASSRYKDWGNDNYLELARQLKQRGFEVLFLLGPQELDYLDLIQQEGLEAVSGLDFGEIAALMNHPTCTKCVIGNDTGLMHLACALDVPSVTIAPDETHFIWFPYETSRHGICHPACSHFLCSRNCEEFTFCIRKIRVADVLKEFLRVVADESKPEVARRHEYPQYPVDEKCFPLWKNS